MVLLVNLARVIFAPLLEEFIAVFGIGEATAGLVATLVWVGSAVPRLPTGWLLTRVPRHRVVLATGGILTVASAFTAAADSIVMVGVGALLMGLSSGVYLVAANPLVSELYPERVGRALGVHGTAAQLAAVIAAPFVTLVLSVFVEWRVVFVCIGVAAFLATVVFYRTARRTELPAAGAADRNLLGAARAQWRVILLGVVILGSTGFVWQGLFNFYELYMQTKGLGSATAKNTLTLLFAAGVPAFFVSGRLADRLPPVPYLLAIVAAFVVAVLALTATSDLVPILLLTAVVGYVVHSLFPALDTYLLDTLPDEHRGSAYAVYSAGMMIVQATGSSAVGVLREGHGAYDVVRAATALLPVVDPLPPGGLSYDAIFTGLSLGLAVVVSALLALQRFDRLPN
ncbi:MFS transporter [Halogeometricum sp. S1BR25-6]|uniref:MFS transporter n=1 Tax=Halogeometricum salsisoli TaxID=2950536 RepID=A0ABU2GCW0_9EURY|nr:MFS transporter [Halogeometricum sp. S1BR25-6]MDS0297953.1 MFS transporter [Halogeometricum sp. S1BR25-6]